MHTTIIDKKINNEREGEKIEMTNDENCVV